MGIEHLSGRRLWVLAVLCLPIYAILGFMGFRSWQACHEAKTIIALTEEYKQSDGHLPDCESDADCEVCEKQGLEQPHAFYTKQSETRDIVNYFGTLGVTRYDSSTGQWDTGYWWNPARFKELAR